jgi:hypothetical protein
VLKEPQALGEGREKLGVGKKFYLLDILFFL